MKIAGRVAVAIPGLTVGLIAGVLTVLFQASYASLLFAGDLAPFVARGVGLMVLGTAIALTLSLFVERPGVALFPQDTPVAVLAAIASAIIAATRATMPVDQTFLTVVAAVILTTALTGLVFIVVGRLDLARFIRFIPHPVIGGFLAGIGWLLVRGGIEMMAGYWPTPDQLTLFLRGTTLLRWAPGIILGVGLTLLTRRFGHYLVMPLVLVAAVGVFYLLLRIADLSIAQATARGWLLGGFGEQRLWLPQPGPLIRSVHWPAIFSQIGSIATITVVSTLAVLLNVTGIELMSGADLEPRRELTVAGVANLAAALVAAPPVYQSLSYSALTARIGRAGRVATAVTAAVCVVALAVGLRVVALVPRPILGAMVVFMGTGLLVEWLYDGWFRLALPDYVLVVLILLVIAFLGVLPGVAVGTLGAVVVFAVSYGRTEVVYRELSGGEAASNVSRVAAERRLLRDQGQRTLVLKLRGFVFFGTAYPIYQLVRHRLNEEAGDPLEFLVLDLRRVRGLDGSAESAIERILAAASQGGATVLIASARPVVRRQLVRSRSVADHKDIVRFAEDLDRALEFCEEQILTRLNPRGHTDAIPSAEELLIELFGNPEEAPRVAELLETVRVDAGVKLIRRGEAADRLFFVASGELGVYLDTPPETTIRLRTMRRGAVFGEIALFLGTPRSVDVVATRPSVCYTMSRAALKTLETTDPDLALSFHRHLIRVLADRLVDVNRALSALSE